MSDNALILVGAIVFIIIVLVAIDLLISSKDRPSEWSQHGIDVVDDTLPIVDTYRPELDDPIPLEAVTEEEVFPGTEAQLRWNTAAELVIIELERAREAIETGDLDEVEACLARAKQVAVMGTRLPDWTVPTTTDAGSH